MNTEELINIRKYLHQNPEISGDEIETSKFVKKTLKKILPKSTILNLNKNGIVATLEGNTSGKHVLLRCELDALPIQETNKFKHKSKIKGVSHKCGHDGHMAIMLAVASHFSENPPKIGKLSLLFQPAEENGEGAKAVLNDKGFSENINPDFVFALHNVPGYQKHSIFCKENIFTPSVISVKVKFFGKTSHAAEPEKGINPSYAIADLLLKSKKLEEHNKKLPIYGIITPIYSKIGSKDHGISAGYGEIDFTLRTWKNTTMHNLREKLMNVVIDTAQEHDVKYELDWFQEFSSIMNHTSAIELINSSAELNKFNYVPKKTPFPWGEDFGLFTERYTGAMFCIGAGKTTPALHNPDYDFPDELITTGCDMFVGIFNAAQKL